MTDKVMINGLVFALVPVTDEDLRALEMSWQCRERTTDAEREQYLARMRLLRWMQERDILQTKPLNREQQRELSEV